MYTHSQAAWGAAVKQVLNKIGISPAQFCDAQGINIHTFKRALTGHAEFRVDDLEKVAAAARLTLGHLAQIRDAHYQENAHPAPGWATDTEPWEGDAGEWYRTLKRTLYEDAPNGKTIASVSVEQWEDQDGLKAPVIELYVSSPDNEWPFTPDVARDMAKALVKAADLCEEVHKMGGFA